MIVKSIGIITGWLFFVPAGIINYKFGGIKKRINPLQKLIKQAELILKKINDPLLYARVDGVEVDGKFLLMELELIEPHLFFDLNPKAATIFSQALGSIQLHY
jgi:hypothetical protein